MWMVRQALVAILALSLTGCAWFAKPADTVSFPRGQAWQAYADMRVGYAVLKLQIDQACRTKALNTDACAGVPRLHEEMMRIDRQVMAALANPAIEVDWAAVGEAIRVIVSLAKLAM